MNTRPKAMRRLSARLITNLQLTADSADIFRSIGHALSQVRGRPVRLRKTAFPPMTASGLWVNRTSHDLIVYEENTRPEHQLVIIGHEAWHMFQGHCGDAIAHGHVASRAGDNEATDALAELAALFSDTADTEASDIGPMDSALHFAARTDARPLDEEVEAERFGFWFATDVQAAVDEARSSADPRELPGRIQISMAHRFRQP
ncbi:toxin-antitoxin system, toxin component [Streptomyces sp. NPDC014991]|uniref:toxin-antitoxin system, toxin component n=1 Tax=Streptomyces sp. NPDC014991 TaxID=3364935 RepID=UPI0036F599EE